MIYVDEMLDDLRERVEDPEDKIQKDYKINRLSRANVLVAMMLHNTYLGELQRKREGIQPVNGTVEISSSVLGYDVLKGQNGITGVKITGGAYSDLIEVSELRKTQNTYFAGSLRKPRHYFYGNEIHILPENAPLIDVYFLKMPDALVEGGVSELNASFRDFIVSRAEAFIWLRENKPDRAKAALEDVYREISLLNQQVEPAKPVGKQEEE